MKIGENKNPTEKNTWRFIKAIMQTGVDLADTDVDFDKDYNPYQINTLLSRHIDTLVFAHRMNLEMLRGLTPRHHFYYLLRVVPKRKRWSDKYPKPDDDEVLNAVSVYTKQSLERCREYMKFLSETQLSRIVKHSKGGIKNERKTTRGEK